MLQNPSVCRSGTPCTPSTFEEAIYCGVYHSSVSAEAVADACDVKVSYLRSALDPHCASARVPAKWLPAILRTTRSAAIVNYLAAELGGLYVALPPAGESTDAVRAQFLCAAKEFGQAAAEVEQALVDGVVTVEELARVRLEMLDAIAAELRVVAALEARLDQAVSAAPPTAKPAPARTSLPAPAPLAVKAGRR